MKLEIPFGESHVTGEVPDRTFVLPSGGAAKSHAAIDDVGAAVRSALAKPLGSAPIRDLVKPKGRVVIAFDDGTVPCFGPYRRLAIGEVLAQLESAGVRRDSVTLICANALHRKFTHDELAVLIGDDLVKEFGARLMCHDAEDRDNLVYFGKTAEHGYDVEVNRRVAEADLTVYVNSSYARGFASGWKSICVGLSTLRSIRCHHTPDGMSMSVKNNRMHAVLDEMGSHLEANISGTVFKVDAIEKNPFEKTHVFAGSVSAAREAAIDVLAEAYPPRRSLSDEKYDVILYGVPDWSPYAIFSHTNPILTLISSGLGYLGGTVQALGKPGCTVIMATPCHERWDRARHPSYPDVWDNVLSQTRDAYDIESRFTDHYASHAEYIEMYRHRFAFHPIHGIFATQPLKRLNHAGRIIVAGIANEATARHVGFEPAASVEAALGIAREIHGPSYSIAYARHPASQTKLAM